MQIPAAPKVVDGWVQLVIGIATLAAFTAGAWRWLLKPLHERIDSNTARVTELGAARDRSLARDRADLDRTDSQLEARIAEVATVMQTAVGRLEVVERQVDRGSMDREGIHHDIGAIEEQVKALSLLVREGESKRSDDMGEIRERLARIETKVDHKP